MKRTLLTILSVLFCAITFAQSVPQGINYQAVARDTAGDVLINQALTIQFSVISDITTSAVSWQETHPVTTNDYGLFTAVIGQGTTTNGGSSATFDVIDWGASNHLLKVEIDYGSGLVDMGTTAFMSVPYALYSAAGSSTSTCLSIGDTAQGGIVFYVSPDGKNGLVAATIDQNGGYIKNWYNASDVISNPSNHTLEGQKFLDWRLPTKYELNAMYSNIGPNSALGNIGGFDLVNDQVDTVVGVAPMAQLDRFLAKIPLVGKIITGGDEKSLVKTYYLVKGNFNDPDISAIPFTSLGKKVMGIFQGILQAPEEILSPITGNFPDEMLSSSPAPSKN